MLLIELICQSFSEIRSDWFWCAVRSSLIDWKSHILPASTHSLPQTRILLTAKIVCNMIWVRHFPKSNNMKHVCCGAILSSANAHLLVYRCLLKNFQIYKLIFNTLLKLSKYVTYYICCFRFYSILIWRIIDIYMEMLQQQKNRAVCT